jgi:hypothetical protein
MMTEREVLEHYDLTKHVRITRYTPQTFICEECKDIARESSVEFRAG